MSDSAAGIATPSGKSAATENFPVGSALIRADLRPHVHAFYRFARMGDEKRLLDAASPWMQRLIMAALDTGCRRGELLGLQWSDVSLAKGEITISRRERQDEAPESAPDCKFLLRAPP